MRAVISRVNSAACFVEGAVTGAIENGLLVVVGFSVRDTEEDVKKMAAKVGKLRIFRGDDGKIKESVSSVGASALAISNFTLYGRVSRTNRPDFTHSLGAEKAAAYFALFKSELAAYMPVESGIFGAHMHIEASHDGPVTLVIESEEL